MDVLETSRLERFGDARYSENRVLTACQGNGILNGCTLLPYVQLPSGCDDRIIVNKRLSTHLYRDLYTLNPKTLVGIPPSQK